MKRDFEKNGNTYRICSICKHDYPATKEYFNKNSVCALGLDYRCNKCRKEYREKNKEHIRIKGKEYRDNNKESIIERRKEYYKNNKEKVLKKCKEYRDSHKEEKRLRDKIYREAHKEEIAIKQKKYCFEHREEISRKKKGQWKRWKRVCTEEKKEKQRERYHNTYKGVHTRVKKRIKELGLCVDTCSICGAKGRTIAHHPDYSKWNEVMFVCYSCHTRIHNGWFIPNAPIINLMECPLP